MIVVGIAGGTGSGKTTFAEALQGQIKSDSLIISQDSYYYARADLSFEERIKINYDHPSSFENGLLIDHLRQLKEGKSVDIPVYDFGMYTRSGEVITVYPKPIVIVEGILILTDSALRDEFDIKVFVDTDPDIRILRRLMRDVNERKRTVESVYNQYVGTVKPMHDAFVEPSKKYADIIVPEGGFNTVALNVVASMLRQHLQESEQACAHN